MTGTSRLREADLPGRRAAAWEQATALPWPPPFAGVTPRPLAEFVDVRGCYVAPRNNNVNRVVLSKLCPMAETSSIRVIRKAR